MDRLQVRSFANRLVVAFVAAAAGLMLLIVATSTLFTFYLYAQTANRGIEDMTSTIQRRIAEYSPRHLPLKDLAPLLTSHVGRMYTHIDVYDANHRLLIATAADRAPTGVIGAVASLMGLETAKISIPGTGGLVVITANMDELDRTLRVYWFWMLSVAVVALILAWAAGVAITRQAVLPLKQISTAMRRIARGDFRPEPVHASGDHELGELAHAYNGALHQLQSAFAQRDRSEAEIRQFIADAGHELRTPLTVIMGYLDMLDDGTRDTPMLQRVVTAMRQESRRMNGLIEKLIYLARLERGEPAERHVVDVSDIITRVVRSAAPQPPTIVAVSTVPDARVVADETDIFEAIRNLVDNALKYAPGSDVAVTAALHGDDVVVEVRDHGPGMSNRDQAHAFDRFYRGQGVNGVEGSGIGLAIVKSATERAGGTVSVESGEGDGAAFTIRLPRAIA
jgi:two-component system, OmpR family, sensor kinase